MAIKLKRIIMPKNPNKKSTFYLKSGNSPLFKMMGSSPVKQPKEETVTEVWEKPTTETIETPKDITTTTSRKGLRTITSPGDIVERPAETPEEIAAWERAKKIAEEKGETFGERYKPKVKEEPLSEKQVDVTPKKSKKSKKPKYETITTHKDFADPKKPIVVNMPDGSKKRMSKKDYNAFIKAEGFSKDPKKRHVMRRESATGKVKYDKDKVDI